MTELLKTRTNPYPEETVTIIADTTGRVLYLDGLWGYSNECQPFDAFRPEHLTMILERLQYHGVIKRDIYGELTWYENSMALQLTVEGEKKEPIPIQDILYKDGRGVTYDGMKLVLRRMMDLG